MSEQFTSVELRIKSVTATQTSKIKAFLEGGKYEVKIFSAVSDGISDQTFHLELGCFPIKSGGTINFGPNGFTVYRNRAGQIPRYLDCSISILEDDSNIRSMAELMSEIRQDNKFKDVVHDLTLAVTNPALKVGLDISRNLLDIGVDILKKNGDDVWLKEYFSFTYKKDGYSGKINLKSGLAKVKLELFVF